MTDPTGDRNDTFLATWERRTGPLLLVAATAPIAGALAGRRAGTEVVGLDLASWLLFGIDYLVHRRHEPGYARTRLGLFDLAVVVVTAPWFLIPGIPTGLTATTRLGRLARLARVFVASAKTPKLRTLGRRLGAAAVYSVVLLALCAYVVERVEPVSSGFATFGDAMWWALVTFTTVGYGDLYPVTTAGRLAAVLLMIGGIALIGSLAGTLGSFLVHGDAPSAESTALSEQTAARLLEELRRLQAEVAELRRDEPGHPPPGV